MSMENEAAGGSEKRYGTKLTAQGEAAIAACLLDGTKLEITKIAAGDGGGAYYEPLPDQTALRREVWRGEILACEKNPLRPNTLDIKGVIPSDAGGFVVRELGVFDKDGLLIGICNTPDMEKAAASSGAGGKLDLIVHLLVTDANAVQVFVKPSLDTISLEDALKLIDERLKNIENIVTTQGGGELLLPAILDGGPVEIAFTEEETKEYVLKSDLTKYALKDSLVGKSMTGQTVQPFRDESQVIGGEGAEIFNDYQERKFYTDESHISNVQSGNVASGDWSHAEGLRTTAAAASDTGPTLGANHAEGFHTTARDYGAHAEGVITKALGAGAHAEGLHSAASDVGSHVEGMLNTAAAHSAHAEGYQNHAGGMYSHVGGYNCKVTNTAAFAHGWSLEANVACIFIVGLFNIKSQDFQDVFVVGGGNEVARSNAFRVQQNGSVFGGEYHASGADYSEIYEWQDGNPDAEDRAGRFVVLDGECIRLAEAEDDVRDILGIVSANPSVVGDSHDDQWRGMYLRDVFGRLIYEDVEIEDPGHPGQTIWKRRRKLNPAYDSSQVYIPQSERPEKSAIGLVGKLVLIDDGTCQVNGWCAAGAGGIAVQSRQRTRFRVMSRLGPTHIRVNIMLS